MINFYLPLKEKLLCRKCPLTCYAPNTVIKTAYRRLTEEEKANETACQQLHDLKASGISDFTLFHWTKQQQSFDKTAQDVIQEYEIKCDICVFCSMQAIRFKRRLLNKIYKGIYLTSTHR